MEEMGEGNTKVLMNDMRDDSLDRMCGLLIAYMVLEHVSMMVSIVSPSEIVAIVYRYCSACFFFFMPWFFFKSGMFYRDDDLNVTLTKSINRLLKPWLKWSAISFVLGAILTWFIDGGINLKNFLLNNCRSVLINGALDENLPLWYLFTLFLVKMIYAWLRKKGINTWIIIVSSFMVAFALSFVRGFKPYWIPNCFLGLLFYTLGNRIGNNERLPVGKWIVLLSIPICLLNLFFPQFVDFRTNSLVRGNYVLYCLMSVCAILGWNCLFKYLSNKLLFGTEGVFLRIGRNSLFFYCAHWIILRILLAIFRPVFSGGQLFFACYVSLFAFLFLLEFILNKRIANVRQFH